MQGVLNFRDVGGIRTREGSTVCTGRLYRSGSLFGAPSDTVDAVAALGVALVVDLRAMAEVEEQMDAALLKTYTMCTTAAETTLQRSVLVQPLASPARSRSYALRQLNVSDAAQIALAMITFQPAAAKRVAIAALFRQGLIGINIMLVETAKTQIYDVLRILSQAAQPVVVNCQWGKDRTGLIIALVLSVLGADEADIVADYRKTAACIQRHEYMDTMPQTYRFFLEPAFQKELNVLIGVDDSTIPALFRYLEQQYGSVLGYLDHIGFDSVWQTQLKFNFVT